MQADRLINFVHDLLRMHNRSKFHVELVYNSVYVATQNNRSVVKMWI